MGVGSSTSGSSISPLYTTTVNRNAAAQSTSSTAFDGGLGALDPNQKVTLDPPTPKPMDPMQTPTPPPSNFKLGTPDPNPTPPPPPSNFKLGTPDPNPTPAPVPPQQVTQPEPPPPPPDPKIMVQSGTGMGAAKSYSMTESEATAVYSELKEHAGKGFSGMSFSDLAKDLKSDYGIDAQQTTVDGHAALVNPATGDTIMVDTNGNGVADMNDMKFASALQGAGVNVNSLGTPGAGMGEGSLNVVMDALAEAEQDDKREQADAASNAKQAAAVYSAQVAANNAPGTSTGGGTAGTGAGSQGAPGTPPPLTDGAVPAYSAGDTRISVAPGTGISA